MTGVGATSLMRWDGFGGFCSSSRPVPPSGYITYRAAVVLFPPSFDGLSGLPSLLDFLLFAKLKTFCESLFFDDC